jgi:phage terminase large subunit-like protein
MAAAQLEKLRQLRTLQQQERELTKAAFANFTSPWYCDRPTCNGLPHDTWYWCAHPVDSPDHLPACKHSRTEQRPPTEVEWLIWLFQAGRGAGKTRSFAEWVVDMVRKGLAKRVALVGRVPSDVRDVMVEGESGILACSPKEFMPEYKPTIRRLVWPNGAIATTYSSENPSELRGPQHDLAWCDELAAWRDARRGDVIDTTWNNLMLGLRLGDNPRCGVSTTPKPVKLIKELVAATSTAITTASTYDNADNLAPAFREQIILTYQGTRIGRQEVMGELLTDVDGALVTIGLIDAGRVRETEELVRTVVAVDPATTSGEQADETGIVTCAKGRDLHGYVLADDSEQGLTPLGWATKAVRAYHYWNADAVVVEKNQGGEAWETIIHAVDRSIRVISVVARQGKRLRAEPCAALYEKGQMHHVGSFPALEDQWTQWVPDSGESPDRMDAMVHGFKELGLLEFGQGAAFLEMWGRNSSIQIVPPTNVIAIPANSYDVPVRCRTKCFYGPQDANGRRSCTKCGCAPPELEAVSGS